MTKRLDYIDQAKGLLIILVVVGHIWQSGPVHNFIYTFHMPAFFLISGILMSYTESYRKGFREYCVRKIKSYGQPFIIMECLGIITDIVRNGVTLNWKGYIFNTLTFNFNEPELWFLVDLCIIEILFWFIIRYVREKRDVIIITFVLFMCSNMAGNTQNSIINTMLSSCQYLIYFVLGFYGTNVFKKKNYILLLFSFIYLLVISIVFGRKTDTGLTLIDVYFLVSGILGAYLSIQFGLMKLTDQAEAMFKLYGKNSLIVYGSHRLIYTVLGICFNHLEFQSTPAFTGIIILVLTMMIEYMVILIINKGKDVI